MAKQTCQHEDLFFINGSLVIQCSKCKARWGAYVEEVETMIGPCFTMDETRKSEWISTAVRAVPMG